MEGESAVYPIGIVTKLTGLTQRQVRYYEAMDLISPARSKGNQRLYSPEDVDTLLMIKALLAKGLTLQGIKSILESRSIPADLESEVTIPQLDHGTLIDNLNHGQPLVSIYPVNNQLTLHQLLLRRWGQED